MPNPTPQSPATSLPANLPRSTGYVPAIGPGLKRLFYVVLFLVALLAANSLYLGTVTFRGWLAGAGISYENYFYLWMFFVHLALGLLLVVPFVAFGTIHLVTSRNRRNRRAVRVGYALFIAGLVVLLTGLALMQVGFIELRHAATRQLVYWLHVGAPLAAGWLYWLHRLAGPRIKWRYGLMYGAAVAGLVATMIGVQNADPRKLNAQGSVEGAKYFEPSRAITVSGQFIPADTLMMDEYCLKCHADAYAQHQHSAHRFSSFNNPMYFASVNETREFAMKRDGNVKASRWCAGCHDPAPFFSGQFDDPKYDIVNHPTAKAGITCTVCHAITSLNSTEWNDQYSTRGNADFTIDEPIHYPFAKSDNTILQWINNQLVKAKPTFHKQTFLKPLHKTSEFCSACHKVHLPYELNHYKEFLRGQDHYNSFLLSGVSGGNARSFYYPEKARENCAECHMPIKESGDFGARDFARDGKLSIHNHLFPAANTALPHVRGDDDATIAAHQAFLKDIVRVDLFGVKEEGKIDGALSAPLRPELPTLKPGHTYLLETVLRTLKVGHLFSQGTVDSNEIWVEVTVKSGDKVIGRNGAIDDEGSVDAWSHFINVFMLDRHGNRIDRRNPQDIFTPLYNKQIPPGAAQIVHFELALPDKLDAPVTVEVKLQYRKFDRIYMDFVGRNLKEGGPTLPNHKPGEPWKNTLPVTTIASDTVTFPVEGVVAEIPEQKSKIAEKDLWQRWNDYGIGLLLEGSAPGSGGGKAELLQAEQAFQEVEKLGRYDGPVNLARVYSTEGRIDEAVNALHRAGEFRNPSAPSWTVAWFSGVINKQQGYLDKAIENFRSVLSDQTEERRSRRLHFERDYVVRNELGQTLYELAKQVRDDENERRRLLGEAVTEFETVLFYDSEDVMAHYNLARLYTELENEAKAELHRKMHLRYKPDDNAQELAVNAARLKYPAANVASEPLVIYPLNRPGAPGLPAEFARQKADDPTVPKRAAQPRPAAIDAAAGKAGHEPKTGDAT